LQKWGGNMAITKQEVVELVKRFHDVTMLEKGTGEDQAAFFLHPEPRIFILHGEDISLQQNYEIHQRLVDEVHAVCDQWQITQLSNSPERARAVGAVYWQGRLVDSDEDDVIKAIVGEDWIVQRVPGGELKIALYINSYHHFLPDSAPIDLK